MIATTSALIRGFMNKYCSSLLLILSSILISCAGENSNESTRIELHSPAVNRQVVALDDIEWWAQIQVNLGPTQDFFFGNSASSQSVSIDGVQRGDDNEIFIKWFEILHGHTVEMSTQSQKFFADGSTLIDMEHLYTQFDYDGDGTANLVERYDGTCVWSSTESCVNQDQKDIPTDNALLNGDFSELDRGLPDRFRYWYSELPVVSGTSGEYCVISPATALEHWEARISYSPLTIFIDENTSYRIVFDVRAQTSSKVYVLMSEKIPGTDNFRSLEDDLFVEVSTMYETKSVRYESGADEHSEVSFSLTFGDGTNNTFCFDNVKLIREASL